MRVLPTDAEAIAFDATLRTCDAASTWLSQQMHASRTFRKFDAHHRFYAELRERFGLASQPTIRVIAKVVAGRLKAVRILGKPQQVMQLCDHRIGETDLICRDGKWFLHATFEAPEAPLTQPANGFLALT